jgi:hypothetical protein
MQAKELYRNGILYNILKADQRSAARACWRSEKRHGGEHFHGFHAGPEFQKHGKF